jgi:hypothetical protein
MLHWPPSLKTEVLEGSRGVGSARTDASWRKEEEGKHGERKREEQIENEPGGGRRGR